jgi:dolichyl-phosphate beta-glucosyltransferase
MPPSLSVIIPMYNESDEVDTILPAVRQTLEARGGEWEIIAVDNASTDDTVARVTAYLEAPWIRLIRNSENRGKGYSVRRGMLAARGERRLICDADCAPSLASLPDLEARLETADIVAGARNAEDSHVERTQPIHRRAASLAFIFLCRQVMGEPLRDVFCGFKLFTGAAAEDIFSRVTIEGWAFDAEALALARALGYRAVPCGITWNHRPGSRLSLIHVAIPVLRELAATRRSLRRQGPLTRKSAATAVTDSGQTR